ncbi:hypothetical protein Bca101_060373 [Brassica carinata]
MSNGGKFELGVASKGKRLCVTTNEGSSYQGIVEQVTDCPLHGAVLLLRYDTMYYLFQYSDIKEMKYEVALNEKINSRDNAVEDPVENIGAKLVPAGNPMDKGYSRDSDPLMEA